MLSENQTTLCPNCDQEIENSKYFLHERMCSLNVKKCPKCNKPFNLDDLNEHIKLVHSYAICDLCNNKFPNGEIENHKQNCEYRLVPCKYCELNVFLKELDEHENTCGSTTKKCPKCGLYIEIKKYDNHLCLNKESEYYNENIIINNQEDEKIEKKKIKLEKNNYKKNKININNKNDKNGEKNKNIIKNDLYDFKDNNKKKFGQKKGKGKAKNDKINNDKNEDNDSLDLNMIYTPEELQNQINALNKYEEMNKINNDNNKINDDKQKKKKKKNKWKNLDEKEFEKQTEIKTKKGKKIKISNTGGKKAKNNIIDKEKEDDKFFDEDEYYTGKKNKDLHKIKYDIPQDKFKNYNKVANYNYGFEYNNIEENMVQEAIKRSLMDQ